MNWNTTVVVVSLNDWKPSLVDMASKCTDDPKYTAEEFKSFCEKYGISHQTSSPHTIHANGDAQTVKKLWNKTVDNHLALLDYRTTPPQISCFVTCSSTDVPAAKKLLVPKAYWQGQPAATTKS